MKKLLKTSPAGVALYLAISAACLSFVFVLSQVQSGRLGAFLDFMNSDVAMAAEQPGMPPAPSPTPSPAAVASASISPAKGAVETPIDSIPQEFDDQSFASTDVLNDRLNLLPDDFKIPPALRDRVSFWFDIYSKYTSHFVLIHDSLRPWIVYRVVDLRSIYSSGGNRFTQAANDHRAVIHARQEVRFTLYKLARKKNYQKLTDEEYKFYKILEAVPGSRRKVFAQAARYVRDQRGQKDFYRQGLISSSLYLNEMEEIFARYDLPVELTRLPLVESSFNLAAQSKVGASGIWQFMLDTGRHYLSVGNIADERNSPLKATEAAARLMLSNFRITHSWPLAITAYNHGAGGVLHAARVVHTNNIVDIVNKYHSRSFSFASQNFYSEFMAALYGEKYKDQIFGAMPKYPPLASEMIDLKYSMRAKTLTDLVGITVEELKLYNPDLRAQAIARATFLPVGYHIRLPVGRKARLELFYQQAEEAKAIVGTTVAHKTLRSQRHG